MLEKPCKLHTGSKDSAGYGFIKRQGKTWRAHRWAAYLAYGPCPDGMKVRHLCNVPSCVEPTHLVYGTAKQNMEDRKATGRTYHKLSAADASRVRAKLAAAETVTAVATEFEISRKMVRNIRDGRQWA